MRTCLPSPQPFARHRLLAALVFVAVGVASAAAPDQDQPSPLPAKEASSSPAQGDAVEKSVVKVFATVRHPDHFKPWNKLAASSLVGTGVVIEGKRILSNAHVILYASQIQVQANEAGDKVTAKVVAISPEIDLALLQLDDESFFDSHPPLARARRLPAITDPVMVYGFPTGGFSLSITKGIVSRVEFVRYNYGAVGLRIQVDAAINPGNSGGPAVVGGKMIGVAFAHLSKSENISYVIPCEEIDLFLNKMVDGTYPGRHQLRIRSLGLQNPSLRSFLRVDKTVHGLAVEAVSRHPADNPLQKWDIITQIGDAAVDDEGFIKLEGGPRVGFNYLVEQIATNNKVPLTVLRSGRRLQLQVPVATTNNALMPSLRGSYPSYFVYGPLVFSEASQDLLSDLITSKVGATWTVRLVGKGNPLLRRTDDSPDFPGERLVVVTSLLPHKLSRGYDDPTGDVVKSVNGVSIKNLSHLVEVLRDATEPFIIIEFEGNPLFNDTLVFSRAEMLAATDDILSDNSIRTQGSSDLMAVWNNKKN
jgi:S1-C subfamily serine protease